MPALHRRWSTVIAAAVANQDGPPSKLSALATMLSESSGNGSSLSAFGGQDTKVHFMCESTPCFDPNRFNHFNVL